MPSRPVAWLDQITVNPTTEGHQEGASITQLANGNILVAWESQAQAGPGSPPGTEILGRILDPLGQPVTGEFRLNNASTAFDEEDASVAALPGGGFVVAYRAIRDHAHAELWIEEYDAGGRQVSEASLLRGCRQRGPAIRQAPCRGGPVGQGPGDLAQGECRRVDRPRGAPS